MLFAGIEQQEVMRLEVDANFTVKDVKQSISEP